MKGGAPIPPFRRTDTAAVGVFLAWCLCVSAVHAGGGPERTVVVVNGGSASSRKIAAVFADLRRIPPGNVVELADVPDAETIDVDVFRNTILIPLLETLKERGLKDQIDCVAYSSDFPTAINVKSDVGDAKLPRVFTPTASINGLTFLYERVLEKDVRYLQLNSNGYYRRELPPADVKPFTVKEAQRYVRAVASANRPEDREDAEKVLLKLAQAHPRQPHLHYNHACVLSRLERGDAAVAALDRAVEAGWWDRRHAERDDDLKPLRDRDDFQKQLAAMERNTLRVQPSRGFRNIQRWNAQGDVGDKDGSRYLLSTVLAVTRGRGTTVEEVIEALKRSAAADESRPKGTVYYAVNNNIRSTARDGRFAPAVARLKELGVRAEVVKGVLPRGKADVAGAMIGTASFDWSASGSRILPGAVCEHFTSFGGVMRKNAGQTPLSEFLRHGAAGASGTVTEPYAISAKFPHAFLHVHYAQGCSLAEAFYQSVAGPYQLLIVGDPLCQPWANRPVVHVDGVQADQKVRGTLELTPTAAHRPATRFELYIDGVERDTCLPGESFALDTTTIKNGRGELRIVAVADDAIETTGRWIVSVVVEN